MVFEDGDCRDKPQIWGFQILSQQRFSNNGDQAPRNKAMTLMTSMPTTPIMMILLLVVVMISSFLSSSNNQKPEQSWRFWNLEPIFFYRFVAQGDPERIPIFRMNPLIYQRAQVGTSASETKARCAHAGSACSSTSPLAAGHGFPHDE